MKEQQIKDEVHALLLAFGVSYLHPEAWQKTWESCKHRTSSETVPFAAWRYLTLLNNYDELYRKWDAVNRRQGSTNPETVWDHGVEPCHLAVRRDT